MKRELKISGIPRTGFEYQDLIGIELLLKYFRDPSLYRWIELESEEPRVGRLDDVVAARADGSFELLQVKYTADPHSYYLDWGWLLAKKRKGTSLLKKWNDALSSVQSLGPVHSAKLRTNRRPDGVFAQSLQGRRIDFDRLEMTQRNAVEKELGGEARARFFFSVFEFSHSEALVDDLEIRLKGEIVPTDTDNSGWLLLREQVRRWATTKRYPEPDGRIRHQNLIQVITKKRPQPIPQNFVVPALYKPPTQEFHQSCTTRIKTGLDPITILWGSPGRGKSTYLSFLIEALRRDELPAVRHHYFLSLDDGTTDRVSFSEIANSLMDQMIARYPDAVKALENDPNQLRIWIEACGNYFLEKGKRFFVVIDGLDHVWREQRNTAQMEHLFNYLLPCPNNVHLLIGTQRVPHEQLPFRLIQSASDTDWVEVPSMDEVAVHDWVEGQKQAGRLLLPDNLHDDASKQLSSVSQAFFEISQGHPLHLIYSFEALVRRGSAVTADDVMLLPTCPDGDIRKYYSALWGRLPTHAKKVLHIIAGSDFHWPPSGLRQCAGSIDDVDHLLEHRRTGVIPFHGSILAYAREQPDHEPTFLSMLPVIIRWLERDAPEYWRWAWLWITKAKNGDPSDLLRKATRGWVIGSLSSGWPHDQIVSILAAAEWHAFTLEDYCRTLELRSLKIRVQNGREYQINRFDEFQECAIRASKNEQQILNLADDLQSLSSGEIAMLSRCVAARDTLGVVSECYEELRHQVNLWIALRHRPDDEFLSLANDYLEVLANRGEIDLDSAVRFIQGFRSRDTVFHALLHHLVRTGNIEATVGLLDQPAISGDKKLESAAQDAAVRIAITENIDLSNRLTIKSRIVSPLLCCWLLLMKQNYPATVNLVFLSNEAVRTDYDYGPNVDIEKFFHTFFFSALSSALSADGPFSIVLPGIEKAKLGWMGEGLRYLEQAARHIADGSAPVTFETIFLEMAELSAVEVTHRPSEPESAQHRAFSVALRQIAFDLHCLGCAGKEFVLVPGPAFESARGSVHWNDEDWISEENERQFPLIEPEAANVVIVEKETYQATTVIEFSQRAERWIDLARLATLYDLPTVSRYVERAADCIIGYGWRKDVWIFDVLGSIENMQEKSEKDATPWLKTLAPIIDQITEFTDGKETNHAPPEFIERIAKSSPKLLPKLYAHYIEREEWWLAEKTLGAFSSLLDFNTTAEKSLTSTFLEDANLHDLDRAKKRGAAGAKTALTRQRRFLGFDATRRKEAAKSKTSKNRAKPEIESLGRRGKPPSVRSFGPSDFSALVNRLGDRNGGFEYRDETLLGWLKYWDDKKKGVSALKSIDEYFLTTNNTHPAESILDEAFQVSLRNEGKKSAYKWLVRAHIERRGWQSYWDAKGRAVKRLEFAAKYYKPKWREFIRDSSESSRYWKRHSNFAIGISYLVHFLLLVGQEELAARYVETMVNITLAELSDQPIPRLKWLH